MPTIRSDEANVSIIPTPPQKELGESPPLPLPEPRSGDVTLGKRERDKQRGDLSASFIYGESLMCSLHFRTQVLNSAVGTVLPHLSYLTPSTYAHTNMPQRSFRPNGLPSKTRQASWDENSPGINNSQLCGKVKGRFLTPKYCVLMSKKKGREWKIWERSKRTHKPFSSFSPRDLWSIRRLL